MEDAYLNNKKYDIKISLPVLKSNVEKWVQEFEPQDKEYFLKLLEQFTYLTQDALAYRMSKLCDCLFSKLMTLGIEKTKVLFVVVESKSGIKSGADEMASNLWNVNRINDLKKSQIITADVYKRQRLFSSITGFRVDTTRTPELSSPQL